MEPQWNPLGVAFLLFQVTPMDSSTSYAPPDMFSGPSRHRDNIPMDTDPPENPGEYHPCRLLFSFLVLISSFFGGIDGKTSHGPKDKSNGRFRVPGYHTGQLTSRCYPFQGDIDHNAQGNGTDPGNRNVPSDDHDCLRISTLSVAAVAYSHS